MTYEQLLKKLNSHNKQVLETVEEAMQMLSAADLGKKAYQETMRAYNDFAATANLECLKKVVKAINSVTGMHMEVR